MLNRIRAFAIATWSTMRLGDCLAAMADRDFEHLGIDRAQIDALLDRHYQRIYTAALTRSS
jgi:hypothetical protein